MELTTHPKVWKVLGAIAALLTAFLLALMYFKWIFLAIVIGIAAILLSERVAAGYRVHAERYGFSRGGRWFYALGIAAFWTIAGYALLSSSIDELGQVMQSLASSEKPLVATYVEKLRPFLPGLLSEDRFGEAEILELQRDGLALLTRFLADLPGFFFNCLLIVPLMFYVYFAKGREIADTVTDAVPSQFRPHFTRAATTVGGHLRSFFEAKLAESAVVGGICAVGFFAAGTKGALVLGLFAGLLNIIPYVGPVIGAIPPIWITLAADEPHVVLYVILTIIIAQLVDNFYLIPFMVSDRIKVNPLLNIILILVGARLYGAVGMLFAAPIYLVYKVVLRDSYRELVRLHDPQRLPPEPGPPR